MTRPFILSIYLSTFAVLLLAAPTLAQKGEAAYATPSESAPLPPSFQGRISYRGTYEGRVTQPGPPLRRLDVRSILRSATGGSTREFAGGYTIDLEIDGNAVTGRYGGTGGIDRGSVSGTRSGSRCRLIEEPSRAIVEAECSATRFAGTIRSRQGANPNFTMSMEAGATRVVEAAQEARERQAAAAASAIQRERRAVAAAAQQERSAAARATAQRAEERQRRQAEARLSPAQAARYRPLLDRIVADDSLGWNFFSYARGSMRISAVETGPEARQLGATSIVTGQFTYGGGSEGWVRVRLSGNAATCVEYQDTFGTCRPPNTPASIAARQAQRPTHGARGWRCDPIGIGSEALQLAPC